MEISIHSSSQLQLEKCLIVAIQVVWLVYTLLATWALQLGDAYKYFVSFYFKTAKQSPFAPLSSSKLGEIGKFWWIVLLILIVLYNYVKFA